MQILAAGNCILLHQWFSGMEMLGLEDGKNCVVWMHPNELPGKISWCLNNEAGRCRIAEAGERLAIDLHSFDSRVTELWALLNINIESEVWRW